MFLIKKRKNLIEHWGSGIPRIIGKVKAAGLREPEFIGGEVDLRINIYRGQIDLNNANKVPDNDDEMPDTIKKVPDNAKIVPDTIGKVPDSVDKMPDTIEGLPDNEQEQQIYSITTAKAVELLRVKHRRARAVLLDMVEGAYLKKEGAARSTIYVKKIKEIECESK